MDKKCRRIYCAGPLFNPKERDEMACIANAVEKAGHTAFLPHRDGLEFTQLLPTLLERGFPSDRATSILNMAIFALDVFEVMRCDGLVLNMNGRVPDEGAMVEAGIAWSHYKAIVIFKNDDRSLVHGNCNPLVMGLSDFKFVSRYEDVAGQFDREFAGQSRNLCPEDHSQFEIATNKGKQISQYLSNRKTHDQITGLLIKLFAEVPCPHLKEETRSFSPTS